MGDDSPTQIPEAPKKKAVKRGRSAKASAAQLGDLSGILAAVKGAETERKQMRAALERIQAVIKDALG